MLHDDKRVLLFPLIVIFLLGLLVIHNLLFLSFVSSSFTFFQPFFIPFSFHSSFTTHHPLIGNTYTYTLHTYRLCLLWLTHSFTRPCSLRPLDLRKNAVTATFLRILFFFHPFLVLFILRFTSLFISLFLSSKKQPSTNNPTLITTTTLQPSIITTRAKCRPLQEQQRTERTSTGHEPHLHSSSLTPQTISNHPTTPLPPPPHDYKSSPAQARPAVKASPTPLANYCTVHNDTIQPGNCHKGPVVITASAAQRTTV